MLTTIAVTLVVLAANCHASGWAAEKSAVPRTGESEKIEFDSGQIKVASQAVLLEDEIRFSVSAPRRTWLSPIPLGAGYEGPREGGGRSCPPT